MQFGAVKKKNKFMMNVNQNYINKIFKELLKQPKLHLLEYNLIDHMYFPD